jgi:hypothetical protein
MDNDERKESTLKNKIDEKVKNKLKDFKELKCLYNLSNDALRFKRNISLIIQERVEKSLNINPKKNNYYTGQSPSTNIFNIKSIVNNVFGDYIKSHNINLEEEVKKELINKKLNKDQKKEYGSEMQKKFLMKKEEQNNENVNRRGKKNYSLFVVSDKKRKISNDEIISKNKSQKNILTEILTENNDNKSDNINKNPNVNKSRSNSKNKENIKNETLKENKSFKDINLFKNKNKNKNVNKDKEKSKSKSNTKIIEIEPKNKTKFSIRSYYESKKLKKMQEKEEESIKSKIIKEKEKEKDKEKDKENEKDKSNYNNTYINVNRRRPKYIITTNNEKGNDNNNDNNNIYKKEKGEKSNKKEIKKENKNYKIPIGDYESIESERRRRALKKEINIITPTRRKNSEVTRHKEIEDVSDEIKKGKERRHLTYKTNKINIDIDDKIGSINKKESIRRKYSMRKQKKKHHRHHHFQHFKKPKRILMTTTIESFSLIKKANKY